MEEELDIHNISTLKCIEHNKVNRVKFLKQLLCKIRCFEVVSKREEKNRYSRSRLSFGKYLYQLQKVGASKVESLAGASLIIRLNYINKIFSFNRVMTNKAENFFLEYLSGNISREIQVISRENCIPSGCFHSLKSQGKHNTKTE